MRINKAGEKIIERFPAKRSRTSVIEAEQAVSQLVTYPLHPNQFSALVCFVQCRGVRAFQRSKIIEYLNAGDPFKAVRQFCYHARIGTKRNAKLARRRKAEQKLFMTPAIVAQNEG